MGPQSARRVVLDPRFRIPYYAYILEGLLEEGFEIRWEKLDCPRGDGLAMHAGGRRIWVDANDEATSEPAPFEWADIVGRANCTEEDATHEKIRLIGPVFGVRLWALPAGYLRACRLIMSGATPRSTISGVRFQGKTRLPIDRYVPSASASGYVFHRSRNWTGKHAATNGPRERFIDALASTGLEQDASIADERIPLGEYLERTKRSSLVFNCPAVHGCLGWKLGEYLALGKAIISTDLGRALPEPFTHGENIHFVDDDVDAMKEAILQIRDDAEYRSRLERGARDWFDRLLTPRAVVRRLVEP
jgi:glycosyltransferase involved in cell wall biosynthesis